MSDKEPIIAFTALKVSESKELEQLLQTILEYIF
jgi:hypothetical protein